MIMGRTIGKNDIAIELLASAARMHSGHTSSAAGNRIEAALASGPRRTHTLPGEILRHMDTEVWLRTWASIARARSPTAVADCT